MTWACAPAPRTDDVGMLERAISYTLGTVQTVTPEFLSRPTPCWGWDLRMLLRHASESLAALHEGIAAGCVGLAPAADDGDIAADPARAFRKRAGRLLGAWTTAGHPYRVIAIADSSVTLNAMAGAGALEIAVHGWDISRACGYRQPMPDALAIDLLAIAPLLVPGTGRHPLFAAPVTVATTAGPSDRLAAFLGRTPHA
jgi:uncharacterized protein (TIGR03086 family)